MFRGRGSLQSSRSLGKLISNPRTRPAMMMSQGLSSTPSETNEALSSERSWSSGRIHFKVCCIKSRQEAATAIRYGATAIGLVAHMPSGPGVISEETIAEIADSLPPCISSFLLTSSQSATDIIAQQRRCRTNTIQIVDELTDGTYKELRHALPGIKLVQVIHVTGPESLDQVKKLVHEPIDAFLLDSGQPTLQTKVLGGTGKVHNWDISKEIIQTSPIPVFLAGGLNPDNIRDAVATLKPYGVDVCSGLRTKPGYDLDEEKIKAFAQHLGLI